MWVSVSSADVVLTDGAAAVHAEPLVDAVPMELVEAREGAEGLPGLVVLQAHPTGGRRQGAERATERAVGRLDA